MRKKSVWALATMAIFAAVLGGACGGDDTGSGGGGGVCGGGCDNVPTFSQLNWSLCTSCHSSDPSVRTAEGVPADSDYTTYTGVSSRIQEIANRVNAVGAVMPPTSSTQLNDAEKEAFTKWGCCDGPQ